jgi:hypothetical protein
MSASHTRRVEDELRRREEMHRATPSQATLSRHAKRETGRASQADKVAQARKDAAKR